MGTVEAWSTMTVFAALYGAAGLLVLAGTADDLLKRGWPLGRALVAGLTTGLAWPFAVAVLLFLKVFQAPRES